MMMIKKTGFFFLFICTFLFSYSQNFSLSESSEITVITVGPGANLNDSFGHSAFRIKDSVQKIDIIYNYGVYDFNTPNFYLKFAQGKLLYNLVVNYSDDFIAAYKKQNRWIKEQLLNLNYTEKQKLFNYLANNAKPENKSYKYDFFYNNCATKLRDVLEEVLGNNLKFKPDYLSTNYTFRELIQINLNKNTWGSLGIDLALGAVIDKQATAYEHMYLPNYIFSAFENATFNEQPLVRNTETLFKNNPTKKSNSFLSSPLMVFGILGLIILFITFNDYKKQKRSKVLDFIIFLITGLIGVFMLLLWFATDHSATAHNYNLLWAFVINVFVIKQILKTVPKLWFVNYIKFLIIALCLLTLHWIFGVQDFAIGLIPLLIALGIRYVYLLYYYKSVN